MEIEDEIQQAFQIVPIYDPAYENAGVELYVRHGALHTPISGNKWFKLKYNLADARKAGYTTLLTFGGAYSNHLAATAAAGKKFGFQTIGLVRGEESRPLNPTLRFAQEQGMELIYVDRTTYRSKEDPKLLKAWQDQYGPCYLIPEGGANEQGVRGASEYLGHADGESHDLICCPVGTGITMAGVIRSLSREQQVIGFSSLKGGEQMMGAIGQWLGAHPKASYSINAEYHFGGYGKINIELVDFARMFYERYGIPLDLVYTAKMMYGIDREIREGRLKDQRILCLHTGGLQGNEGMKERYGVSSWYSS